jgi:hypothetical protein
MPCFICFLNFSCNEKWPKNKSSQNDLKIWYDFFLNISDFFLQITSEGVHQVGTTHLGTPAPPGAPWWVVVPTWALSLIPSLHIITYLHKKNHHCSLSLSLSRVLALKPMEFDLFARSSISETVSGDCCLVCASSIGPISFCFSGLYLE